MCLAAPHTLNKLQYPADRDVLKVTWFYKKLTLGSDLMWPKPLCHKRTFEAISGAFLHLLHLDLFTSPRFNSCPSK
jgi:hypothetical protein